MPPSAAPQFLTVSEVAQALRVSRMTVYRMVEAGELSAIRVGRSYRVPQHALDSFIAASRVAPGEPLAGEGRAQA